MADFKYPDCEGVLTALFYGDEIKEAWKNHWPTFYLEVKSTSGGRHEPFHMSRAQVEHVSDIRTIVVHWRRFIRADALTGPSPDSS